MSAMTAVIGEPTIGVGRSLFQTKFKSAIPSAGFECEAQPRSFR